MEWLLLCRGATLAAAEIVAQSTDEALLQVVRAYLTLHPAAEQARFCPECQVLFVPRHGKQRYCSRACVNRVGQRRWRQEETNRAKERDWARRRHGQKQATRNGQED